MWRWQRVRGDSGMCVGTAAHVHGTVAICLEMVARVHGDGRRMQRDSWHLICTGTACVCMGTAGVCTWDSPGMHRDGRCLHGTAGACVGTAAVGTGTASMCIGTASMCIGTAWDTAGVCTMAMPGAAAVGAGRRNAPTLMGSVAAPPGRRWVTFLVAPGEGLGPSCLLRELAHTLLNAGWDGAGPTRVRESPRSLFTSRLGFHPPPHSPSLSQSRTLGSPALFPPQIPHDGCSGLDKVPTPWGALLEWGISTTTPQLPSRQPLLLSTPPGSGVPYATPRTRRDMSRLLPG